MPSPPAPNAEPGDTDTWRSRSSARANSSLSEVARDTSTIR